MGVVNVRVSAEVPNLDISSIAATSKEVTDKNSKKKSRGNTGGDGNGISNRRVVKLWPAFIQGK